MWSWTRAHRRSALRRASTGTQGSSRGFFRRGLFAKLGLVLLAITAVAASAGPAVSAKSSANSGGSATFALPPGFNPNYILPIEPAADDSVQQFNLFQFLMYRPLYWQGNGSGVAINKSLSLADLPVYTDGGRTVTITLKHYLWSDGQPLTSRDISFWLNLVTADKAMYASYTPGELPDNIVSFDTPNSRTIVLHLDRVYNESWFTGNELVLIQPMPQHVWDKESASGSVGNYDTTTAGAHSVYAYLNSQSQDLATYASNPLWQVVDGPWKMKSFSASGPITYVPNADYSGPTKPSLSKFVELPFTSAAAEQNVLLTGGVDYGYVDPGDTSVKSQLRSSGFRIDPWLAYQFSYLILNFNTSNSALRNEYRQLYIRQALQHLIDEPAYVKVLFHGAATPTNGPVPLNSTYVSKTEKTPLYPFSVAGAKKLLEGHGWKVRPGGTTTCSRPGTGSSDCGSGIPAGAAIAFSLMYYSGTLPVEESDESFASSAGQAGIHIQLRSTSIDTVFNDAAQCTPKQSACSWQSAQYGGWTPFVYPVVEFFLPTSPLDVMSFKSADATKYYFATEYSNSSQPVNQYEDYLAKVLPVLWEPSPDTQVSAISHKLDVVGGQNPTLGLTPETWKLS